MLHNGKFALRAAMARVTGLPGNVFPRQGNTATGIAIVAAIRVFASRRPIKEELSLRSIRTATSIVQTDVQHWVSGFIETLHFKAWWCLRTPRPFNMAVLQERATLEYGMCLCALHPPCLGRFSVHGYSVPVAGSGRPARRWPLSPDHQSTGGQSVDHLPPPVNDADDCRS